MSGHFQRGGGAQTCLIQSWNKDINTNLIHYAIGRIVKPDSPNLLPYLLYAMQLPQTEENHMLSYHPLDIGYYRN